MAFLSLFGAYFGGWFWPSIAVIEVLALMYFSVGREGKRSTLRVTGWLRSKRGTRLYERWVGAALDWVDRALRPDDAETSPPPEGKWAKFFWLTRPHASDRALALSEGKRAFGWPLLDFSMRLAIVYPVLFLVGYWGVSGNDGLIGGAVVLPAESNWLIRAVTLAAFAILFGLVLFSYYARAKRRLHWENVAFWLVGGLAFAVAVAAAPAAAPAVAVAVALALASALAAAPAVALASALAVASALTFAVVSALAPAFAVASALAAAPTVAVASALAVANTLTWAIWRGYNGRLAYTLFVAVLAALLIGAAALLPADNAQARVWLLFLGLLPLANACFDYLSFGITRWLIRAGVKRRDRWTIFFGVADLGAAVVLFTGLGLFLVALLTAMNAVSAAPVVDLQATLIDIRDHPGNYWWLYLSFFSTLIPTFMHFALSTACLVAWIPRRCRLWVRSMLHNKSDAHLSKLLAPMILSLMATFSIVAPIALTLFFAMGIQSVFPDIGHAYLWLFAEFAEFLGAPVEPETIWV